ncbi:DnaT-like ssDNA-binding domain-containing protein [Endozoicomonas sp. SESOKO1]|uniref:DnaT-like ssDNA-binding domain-containing protein n=1 Tax=Endozoicomonas sp. SESOKO1 TaxID=2828742 RepID=UPI0021472D3E|nr:DnaT-like ssDNA-binding domain-containing protein [Endozoicomonas sp. SESOKO1]
MTDENKHYIRQLNAGALPWDIEPETRQQEEHPVFAQAQPVIREGARVQPLPDDFAPSREILEFLQAHQGIPLDFIATQLIDFKLYWHETGEARKAWQNKFKSHVIYQWKRNQSETGQRSHRSTAEKLTDRSWDDGFQFEDGDE